MQTYQGRCHCGSIQLPKLHYSSSHSLQLLYVPRKGAAMLSHTLTPDALHISDNEGTLTEYQLGSFEAKHFFCTRCGIYTFHQTKRALGQYRVNLACIDALALPVEVFDDQHLL